MVAPMDFNAKDNEEIKQAYWEERKKLDNKIADVEYQLTCLKEIKNKSIESLIYEGDGDTTPRAGVKA
jgi:hypothetical protein